MTATPTLLARVAAQRSDDVSSSPGGGAGGQQAGDEVPGPLDPAPPTARPEEQPERCRNAAELRGRRVPNSLVLEPREDGGRLFKSGRPVTKTNIFQHDHQNILNF